MMTPKIKKKNNIWYFDDYFDFLYKKEKEIPESIRHFILDPKRYLFNTQETLHDAILTEFKFSISKDKDKLLISFLSPYQDRHYKFIFNDVINISFKTDDKTFKNNDLLIHQFLFKSKEVYSYEFIFVNGQKVTINFKQLQIIEEMR